MPGTLTSSSAATTTSTATKVSCRGSLYSNMANANSEDDMISSLDCGVTIGTRRRKSHKKRRSNKNPSAAKTPHWRRASAATSILERVEEKSTRVQEKLEKTVQLLKRSRTSSSTPTIDPSTSISEDTTSGKSTASIVKTSCPCGKPNSRSCKRGVCGGKSESVTVTPTPRSDRAIKRQEKRDARRERLANRTHELSAKASSVRRRVARQAAKAVETSAVVSEQKDREIANKFEQRLKDSCHGYSPATGTYTTSYATSYCYTSSYQPVMHSGRSSTKHSSSTSSSSQKTPFQPVLSEYSPIETQDCWFSAPLSGQSTIEEALRKLVPEPTFKDKTSTCAVCTCELIDEDDDDDVVDSEVGDTTPMKITDDADAEENGQASSIKSEAKVNDTTSDTNHDGDEGDEVVSLSTCSVKHFFHRECITQALNYCTRCPECFTPVIPVTGPQPQGRMSVSVNKTTTCAGFERASKGTIVIQYSFPSGIQDERHPNPGSSYSGTYRTAYLPNTPEGRVVLAKLQVAFDRRHLFCVGTSLTTGLSNTVVWNSIHHKTCLFGGAFGFPDATYLTRVSEELRAVGIE